jgi:DNA-directed RNA polymerase specialized sigma24 family protein
MRESQHPSFTLAESDEAYFVQVPAQFLKLIKLLHYEKMNYAEIATQAGIPLGTVKSRIFRGREIIYRLRAESEVHREVFQQPAMAAWRPA